MNPDIIKSFFKSYDIRGTYPTLTKEVYYWTGRGLIEKVLKPEGLSTEVIICRDTRYSGPELCQALINGILDAGGKIIYLGVTSSDFMYAATQILNKPGVIATASHNPKDDNGMKMVKYGSTMLGMKEGLAEIRDFVVENYDKEINIKKWIEPTLNNQAFQTVESYFIDKIKEIGQTEEVDKILSNQNKKLKIAVDAGNGMGGFVMPYLQKIYKNIEFVDLYWELDGNFPNHPADPQNFENLKELIDTITNNKDVDFGFAFDGDADRVFFIDDKGEVVQGDFLVAFFAKTLLEEQIKNPDPNISPSVVYIQPGSRCVVESIAESCGIAIPSKQGHTHIKREMTAHKSVYGGEFSGHHYFAQFGNMDSGVLAAVLMIKILAESNSKLSEVFKPLRESYFISDLINIRIPEGLTFEDLKKRFLEHFNDAVVSEFDGFSCYYPDWKFSMRPSGTEPVVRFILETRFTNRVQEKLNKIKKILGI